MRKETSFEQLPDNFDREKILYALNNELYAMKKRREGREKTDVKYTVLENFIDCLECGKSFDEAFSNLSEPHKHAVLTRLENQAEHIGGNIPLELIERLKKQFYGVIAYEDDDGVHETPDIEKIVQLEEELQKENAHLYR